MTTQKRGPLPRRDVGLTAEKRSAWIKTEADGAVRASGNQKYLTLEQAVAAAKFHNLPAAKIALPLNIEEG